MDGLNLGQDPAFPDRYHQARSRAVVSRRDVGARHTAVRVVDRRSRAQALSQLQREHVALLVALCELEARPAADAAAEAVNAALAALLREDLRRTQHALQLAASGAYGRCEHCRRTLSRPQIALHPASTHCPACAARVHATQA